MTWNGTLRLKIFTTNHTPWHECGFKSCDRSPFDKNLSSMSPKMSFLGLQTGGGNFCWQISVLEVGIRVCWGSRWSTGPPGVFFNCTNCFFLDFGATKKQETLNKTECEAFAKLWLSKQKDAQGGGAHPRLQIPVQDLFGVEVLECQTNLHKPVPDLKLWEWNLTCDKNAQTITFWGNKEKHQNATDPKHTHNPILFTKKCFSTKCAGCWSGIYNTPPGQMGWNENWHVVLWIPSVVFRQCRKLCTKCSQIYGWLGLRQHLHK